MKLPQQKFRLIIIGFIVSMIFGFALRPSSSSAISNTTVASSNFDSKMPGLSKISINAPNAPDATDDEPFITINDVTVNEGDVGTTDAVFWVSLSEAYTDTVTVDYATQDSTAAAPDDYISTFGTLSFIAEQDVTLPITVTIQGDYMDEINETYTVTLSNPINGVLDIAEGLGTIIDDDTAGITVSPLDLTTYENGTTDDIFTVVLDSQPTAVVTITLNSLDVSEGTVLPAQLVFTDSNWSTSQDVTVTGQNDDIEDGDITYDVQITTNSLDQVYNAVDPAYVSVTNGDDDTAGVIVNPISDLTTAEIGTTDNFTVVLTSEPTADITVNLLSSNMDEGIVSTNSLTFTSDDWDIEQTVIITGVDDFVDDGDTDYVIQVTTSSANSIYDAIDPSDVGVTNADNDAAGVTINPLSGLTTSEIGTTDTFTIVLDSQPTYSVIIYLNSSDNGEGTVDSNIFNLLNFELEYTSNGDRHRGG